MFDQKKILAIPGMIEPIEQKTLYELTSQINLEPGHQIVEFGSFFGRSTACLAQGLTDNPKRTKTNKVYTFDSFGCASVGGFAVHVENFARLGAVSDLVRRGEERLDFYPVFEYYLSEYLNSGHVNSVRAEIKDSLPETISCITLMHIDSPKHYEELRLIVERFFPLLKNGSIIVFQDYFYHWSATLVAAIEAMRQLGFLTYHFSAASSLVTQIQSEYTAKIFVDLEQMMRDKNIVFNLLNNAADFCTNIQIDRPEIFKPRLWLATYQYLWGQGKFDEASDLFLRFFSGGGKVNHSVLNDYMEMMRAGFSVRDLYEADHPK